MSRIRPGLVVDPVLLVPREDGPLKISRNEAEARTSTARPPPAQGQHEGGG